MDLDSSWGVDFEVLDEDKEAMTRLEQRSVMEEKRKIRRVFDYFWEKGWWWNVFKEEKKSEFEIYRRGSNCI